MLRYDHLLGRPYIPGKQDCGTIIQDFYLDNFGIPLTDYARPDDWWKHGMNIFYDICYDEGFKPFDGPVEKMQVGDVLLMGFGCPFPNHTAVYVGDGQVIQHFHGKLSNCELIRSAHRDALLAVMRRPDIIIKPLPEKELNLADVLSPYWKARLAERLGKEDGKEIVGEIKKFNPSAAEVITRAVADIAQPGGD